MELPTREVLVAFCVMLMAPALQLSPVLQLPSHANRLAHGRSNGHHGQVSQSHTSLLRHKAGDSPLLRHNAGGLSLLRHNGFSSGTGIQRFANESSPNAKHLTDSVKQNASQKTGASANLSHSDFDFLEQGDVHNVTINDTDNGKHDSLDIAKSDVTQDMKLNVIYGAKNTNTTPTENNHISKRHSGSEFTTHVGASLDSSDILRSKRSFQIANDNEISQDTDRLKKLKMMYLESWLKENAPKDEMDNRLNTFLYKDDSDVNVENAVSDTLSSPNSLDHWTAPAARKHEEELTSKVYRNLLGAMQTETAYEHTYLVQLKARTMAQFAKQRLTLLRSVISPRESSLQDDKPLTNVWDDEVSENKVEASFAHGRSSDGSPGRDARVEVNVKVPMDDLPQPHRWRDSPEKEQGRDSPIVLQRRPGTAFSPYIVILMSVSDCI
ncbi:uncharacterized protein [Littorina saxatilis]|uniref:uncharacterized protein n=1 Tax=Littorina saxatilis TaxID=31220 RepID=UPI0038B54A87